MNIIRGYFPDLTAAQVSQFNLLMQGLQEWNEKINLISRKDTAHMEVRHILHSLSIGKLLSFLPGTNILDVGTGGGFPGLPLAILFPECRFTLVDSIGKKIGVVNALAESCNIPNVKAFQSRAEQLGGSYDFVVSRAVAPFPRLYNWTRDRIGRKSNHSLKNGILALKGGDLEQELQQLHRKSVLHPINQWFHESWFELKYVVHVEV